jgi:hypothetical protein
VFSPWIFLIGFFDKRAQSGELFKNCPIKQNHEFRDLDISSKFTNRILETHTSKRLENKNHMQINALQFKTRLTLITHLMKTEIKCESVF